MNLSSSHVGILKGVNVVDEYFKIDMRAAFCAVPSV